MKRTQRQLVNTDSLLSCEMCLRSRNKVEKKSSHILCHYQVMTLQIFSNLMLNLPSTLLSVAITSSKVNMLVKLLTIFAVVTITSGQIIQIEDGQIEGRQALTRSGVMFNGFYGIPFAEPPIGELRFIDPVPKRPWNGILNCTVFGPMCMQFGAGIWGSEDCLQLNVFTKNLPSANETVEQKPVIAFIHGGGFATGTAMNHGPEYLMDRDVVLVTIQYRLGAFGFMALEIPEIPGNQGLKDQNLALKWIQANIHHFGGDRNRVTIAGLSAGSLSVTAHMVSPMSRGLFHNVIGMSGSIAGQLRPVSNNIEFVKEMATRFDCNVTTIGGMLDCLRNVGPRQFCSENFVRFVILICRLLAKTLLMIWR